MTLQINIQNLSYKNHLPLITNENYRMEAGTFLFLQKPSGFGKSTLLRYLAGIQNGQELEIAGNIGYGNVKIELSKWENRLSKSTQPFFSLMTQTPHLLPWKTVRENIQLSFLSQNKVTITEQNDRITNYLNSVYLSNFENKKISELSGGQKSRVHLIRTLCQNRAGLLLDEPFASLDQDLKNKILVWLQDELKNKYVFVVMH